MRNLLYILLVILNISCANRRWSVTFKNFFGSGLDHVISVDDEAVLSSLNEYLESNVQNRALLGFYIDASHNQELSSEYIISGNTTIYVKSTSSSSFNFYNGTIYRMDLSQSSDFLVNGTLTIPKIINGVKVTALSGSSSSSTNIAGDTITTSSNTTVINIIGTEWITQIGVNTFYNFTELLSYKFPSDLSTLSVGSNAFTGTSKIVVSDEIKNQWSNDGL